MSEFKLTRKTALNLDDPVNEAWEGLHVAEIVGKGFFWLTSKQGVQEKLADDCRRILGFDLPAAGRFETGEANGAEITLAWLGKSQWSFRGSADFDVSGFSNHAQITDQSDGWVGITIKGAAAREVLSRLLPLDLDPSVFPEGSAARSPVEGMHCHLCSRGLPDRAFELFFQRSSARSFLGHLRHAAYSVCGERMDGQS